MQLRVAHDVLEPIPIGDFHWREAGAILAYWDWFLLLHETVRINRAQNDRLRLGPLFEPPDDGLVP